VLVRRHSLAREDGDENQCLFLGDDTGGRGTKSGGDDSDCAGVKPQVIRAPKPECKVKP
jgi:hypothetical protein